MNMFKKIIIFSLLSCLISSCIREDRSDCPEGFRLQFSYTHNNTGEDRMAAEVGDLRFYVFDKATGLLVDIIKVGAAQIAQGWIDVSLPNGNYTIVAWAGSGPDLFADGYIEADMTDPSTHSYAPGATIGVTTLDNFRVMLACDTFSGAPEGDITPCTGSFDDLFFAMQDVTVNTAKDQTVNFDFIKNTSVLSVEITGLEYLSSYTPVQGKANFSRAAASDQPLLVFATARNERYMYDNLIGANGRTVRYEPPYTALTATDMQVDIQIQRLDVVQHTGWPVLLYIQDVTTGSDMVQPINVLDAIMRVKDSHGNLRWPTQREIDNEDVFPFRISILHDLSVNITVEGFEIEDTDPNIGRP